MTLWAGLSSRTFVAHRNLPAAEKSPGRPLQEISRSLAVTSASFARRRPAFLGRPVGRAGTGVRRANKVLRVFVVLKEDLHKSIEKQYS